MQLQMNQSKCQRRQPSRMVVSSSEEDIFDGRCLLVVIGLGRSVSQSLCETGSDFDINRSARIFFQDEKGAGKLVCAINFSEPRGLTQLHECAH